MAVAVDLDAYERLAERLTNTPNGLPRSESGAELKLLAKMFMPEEAELASVMRLTCEPPAAIAARVNLDAEEARRQLKQMVRRGLIRAKKRDDGLAFGLMPFVVGSYEEQLPRMDAEMAALFEEYFQETKGGIITQAKPSANTSAPCI